MEARISGQAPAPSESTLKYGKSAAVAAAAQRNTRLTSERIPHPRAHIFKVRHWISAMNEISAAHEINCQKHRWRHHCSTEPDSWTRFGEIGPALPPRVQSHVQVSVDLRP